MPSSLKQKRKRSNLVIGIDPGTGVSSPMGFALIEPETKQILFTAEFWTKYKKLEHRIRDISEQFEAVLTGAVLEEGDAIFIEYFVMRGKGGETLQRMIGSIMGRTPYDLQLDHVQNTSVKLIVGGAGTADKVDVARGLRDYFNKEPARKFVQALINKEQWDQLDALAIGLAGWHRSHIQKAAKERNEVQNGTRSKAKTKVRKKKGR